MWHKQVCNKFSRCYRYSNCRQNQKYHYDYRCYCPNHHWSHAFCLSREVELWESRCLTPSSYPLACRSGTSYNGYLSRPLLNTAHNGPEYLRQGNGYFATITPYPAVSFHCHTFASSVLATFVKLWRELISLLPTRDIALTQDGPSFWSRPLLIQFSSCAPTSHAWHLSFEPASLWGLSLL